MRAAGFVLALLLAACAKPPTPDVAAEAAYQRGYAALSAGDWAAARTALAEAQRGLPDDPYIALDLGVACQHLGDREAARAQYKRVVETGAKLYPRSVTDPTFSGATLAQIAAADLAALDK